MVCITVAFNLDQQRWTRAFDVEWGSTIWQLKEQMLSPEGTREDAEAFELQRLGRRVPDTEKVYQEHTLDFEYLGPEEGARRARQETQDLEQWERQKAEEEAARRSRPKPAPEAPAAGPAKPKEALPFDTAPVVKAAPPLPAGEHEITITIDRSMDLKTSVTVQGGSNVLAVKERLSATDPTGQMNVASFGLGIATGSEEPATAISDEVVLTEKHLQLEITEPYVETAESRANAPMPYTPATRPKVEPTPPPPPRWEVVGGGDKGGILVRKGKEVTSPAEESRLAHGALVQELELDGERLHYRRLTGSGPEAGWVSVRLKDGKDLLVRTEKRPPEEPAPPAEEALGPLAPPPEGTWRVLYHDVPGRGQQLRLLFIFTGTPFEDRRLQEPDGVNAYKSAAAGDASPLAFDFVPIVQHGGLSVSTTAGAMQYAGEVLGLIEDDLDARARAVMTVVASESMRNEVFYPAYGTMMKMRSRLRKYPPEPYERWLGHFERLLHSSAAEGNRGPGPFLLGPRLCYADLALYDCLTSIWDLGCFGQDEAERARKFPQLCALVEAVDKSPSLASYGRPHARDLEAKLPA